MFIEILQSYQRNEKSVAELFDLVCPILADHTDLLMEFISFLPPNLQDIVCSHLLGVLATSWLTNLTGERASGSDGAESQWEPHVPHVVDLCQFAAVLHELRMVRWFPSLPCQEAIAGRTGWVGPESQWRALPGLSGRSSCAGLCCLQTRLFMCKLRCASRIFS